MISAKVRTKERVFAITIRPLPEPVFSGPVEKLTLDVNGTNTGRSRKLTAIHIPFRLLQSYPWSLRILRGITSDSGMKRADSSFGQFFQTMSVNQKRINRKTEAHYTSHKKDPIYILPSVTFQATQNRAEVDPRVKSVNFMKLYQQRSLHLHIWISNTKFFRSPRLFLTFSVFCFKNLGFSRRDGVIIEKKILFTLLDS